VTLDAGILNDILAESCSGEELYTMSKRGLFHGFKADSVFEN
jgi:hypothetical protein